jgi:hypothetical protein
MRASRTRRQFLGSALPAVALSLWAPTLLDAGTLPPDCERLRRVLGAFFWERPGARVMMANTAGPGHCAAEAPLVLIRSILGPISIGAASSMAPRSLRRIVVRQIQRDFVSNDTVCVDGWILSRMEARLYALARSHV